jgi:hypothetical protein
MAPTDEALADAELDRAIEVYSRRSALTADVTGCAPTSSRPAALRMCRAAASEHFQLERGQSYRAALSLG